MITKAPKIDRRSFIIGTAAVGSGLALGLKIPFGATVVRAQDGSPEINAWVVIRPDDTVVIRVARSEMGQGTITGLARSEEHTSELQSPCNLVCRLLLEKKKKEQCVGWTWNRVVHTSQYTRCFSHKSEHESAGTEQHSAVMTELVDHDAVYQDYDVVTRI